MVEILQEKKLAEKKNKTKPEGKKRMKAIVVLKFNLQEAFMVVLFKILLLTINLIK